MPTPSRMNVPKRANAPKSTMFPHTVTVYNSNTEESPETGFRPVLTNYITVLKGVLLDESKGANVRDTGLTSADAATLYVPFGVKAVDGVTREEKQYIGPMEFWRLPDKTGFWTFSLTGKGGQTFFVKGDVVEPEMTFENISSLHDGVFDVTKVDEKDYGGLQHWEVGGA